MLAEERDRLLVLRGCHVFGKTQQRRIATALDPQLDRPKPIGYELGQRLSTMKQLVDAGREAECDAGTIGIERTRYR